MTILETKNLKKYYGSDDIQVRALDGVDLKIEDREFLKKIVQILGPENKLDVLPGQLSGGQQQRIVVF